MRSAVGCIGLGVLLLVVAGTFDAEPLYVTGCALILLAAAALAWIVSGARGASIHRTLERRSVVEEEPLGMRIEARAGRLPLPPGWIDEPLLREPIHMGAGKRTKAVRVEVTFARRGLRHLEPPRLVLRDPFGLVERVVTSRPDELTILPRTYPVRATATGGDAAAALRTRAGLTAAAETEMDGLRPLREGAPASRIHWQSLARGHGLMERRLISEADSRPIVVVDLRGAAHPEDTDKAVRAAASLTVHFAAQGGCALLLPGDRRATIVEPDLLAWPAAHVRLAVLGDVAGPALHAAQNRRGLTVLVAARALDRPPRGLGRMPGGCLLVVPADLPGRRPVVEVAGCRGYLAQRTGAAAALAAVGAT